MANRTRMSRWRGAAAAGTTWGQQHREAFISNPIETVGYHAVAVLFTTATIYRSFKGGLECVLRPFLVALLVILLILAARTVMPPGSAEGLRFLFVPEWSLLPGTGPGISRYQPRPRSLTSRWM